MIERNLGNLERVIRLLAGLLLLAWAITRPTMNGVDWFILVVSLALVLNGVFQRCYLWFVLDINTHARKERKSSTDPFCQS